jgi:hypothetical protein
MFRDGFADALRFAYLLPVAALVIGALLTFAVRRPADLEPMAETSIATSGDK